MSEEAEESSSPKKATKNNSKTHDHYCYVCKKSGNNLIEPCNNCKSSVLYHKKCLEEMIQNTNLDQCLECNTKFAGIKIRKSTLNFCHYIRAKPEELSGIIISIPIFSFLYYIIYLGVIAYIVSKGIIDNTLRWILLVPTIVFGLLFTLMAFGFLVSLCYRYHKWKGQNHRVTVIPINKSSSNKQSNKKPPTATSINKTANKEIP